MARQYGAPKDANSSGPGYTDRRRDQTPKAKDPDPSPPADVVAQFHKNAEVDRRRESIHHTLGVSNYQASPGDHNHRGGDSRALFEGMTLTGNKGGNAALANLISILVQFGLSDNTGP